MTHDLPQRFGLRDAFSFCASSANIRVPMSLRKLAGAGAVARKGNRLFKKPAQRTSEEVGLVSKAMKRARDDFVLSKPASGRTFFRAPHRPGGIVEEIQ